MRIMPQPGFWYMDQLAGKQEKEYNRINEELKNNPTFEVPAEMRKASYRTIKKEFSKPIEQQQNGLLGKYSSAYLF